MMSKPDIIKSYLPPLLLVVSVFVFFSEIWITGKPLFGSDFVLYFHPWKQYLYNHFQATGEVPLWNPYVLSGTPYLADLQTSLFYPLGFLFYLMPSAQAYGYTVILHWILGILSMYCFARSIPMNRAGAFLSSIVFVYNGYVVGHLYAGHLTFVQNYFWISFVFLLALKYVRTKKVRYAAWCGLVLGIQILGGFPQIAFYTILAVLLFFGYASLQRTKESGTLGWWNMCGGVALFLLLGFALAAIQLLPTYEFAALSTRSGGVSYEFATTDSFPPIHFLTFLMPNLFGNPANATYWKSPETWKFWELCGYVGIGSLLLLFCLTSSRRSSLIKRFFLLLWGISLFLSLGKYNPLYPYIYYLPGFHHFRIPAQILFLHVFSIAILAGLAFDRLALDTIAKKERFSPLFTVLCGGLLFSLGLMVASYFWDRNHFFRIALAIINPDTTISDLGAKVIQTVPLSLFSACGFVFLFFTLLTLHQKRIIGRAPFVALFLLGTVGDLWSFGLPMVKTTSLEGPVREEQLAPTTKQNPDLFRMVSMGKDAGPRESILYGYHDVHGYTPMILKRYLEYLNKSQGLMLAPEAVNVRYVTHVANNMVRLLNVRYTALDRGTIADVEHFFPRAFIVNDAETLPSDQVLDYLASPQFSPKDVVVLEQATDTAKIFRKTIPLDGHRSNVPFEKSRLPDKRCRITRFAQDELLVSATLEKSGYLVLSEIVYPGWNAYVNGEQMGMVTGNYIFRTVPLPPGSHLVHLKFEPRSFLIGTAVSGMVLLGFLLAQLTMILRRKQ